MSFLRNEFKIRNPDSVEKIYLFHLKNEHLISHDMGLVNKMASNILCMLNLIRFSNVKSENLGKFEEVFEWRTELGKYVAAESTEIRDDFLNSVFERLNQIKKERNRYVEAISAFVQLLNAIGLQQFTGLQN